MVNDLKDFLKERIKNPFLAALTFFWIAFNWKILAYIFFSSDTIELKIECYRNYYQWYNFYLYPFLSAIGYVIISTFIFAGIEWLSVKGFLIRRKVFYTKLEGDIKAQEKVEIAKFHREEARSGFKERKELNDKIDSLIKEIEEGNLKIEEERKRNTILEGKLDTGMELFDKEIKQREEIIKQINLDFQYDLRDPRIQKLIKDFEYNELDKLSSFIGSLIKIVNRRPFDGYERYIKQLEEINAGKFTIDKEKNQITNIELTPIGKYLLKRNLYSKESMNGIKFNFDKLV